MALYDLSSSWMTGSKCPLAKRGYSRDGKKNLPQIEYAVLTDPAGCPVAVRVFAGNTADPTAFTAAVTAVKDTFALENMVLVGDRGMITTARISALKQIGGLGWLTALRAPQIAALAADTGPLQMSLFDEQNFAEISHPDYPGERLDRLPEPRPGRAADPETRRAAGRHRDRVDPDPGRGHRGPAGRRRQDRAPRREGPGQTQDGQTLPARDHRHHPDHHPGPAAHRRRGGPGRHLRAPQHHPRRPADTAAVIGAYKNLANVEKDFRSLKAIDIDLRPSTTTWKTGSEPTCSCVSWPPTSPGTSAGPWPNSPTPTKPRPPEPIPSHPRSEAKPRRRKPAPGPAPTGYPCTPTKACSDHLATLTRNDIQYSTNGPNHPDPGRTHPRPTPRLPTPRHTHPDHLT